jgi:mycofactocin precursor peptide peptidase
VTRLAALASPDVAAGAVLAVPLGATEQHGPHLPLGTDTDVAVALCERLANARADVVVAPALPYGSSGEHAGFPGTLSIGAAATELVVLELGRSATGTFSRIVFVSGHGGNAEAVAAAVTRLRYEARDVRAHFPRWPGEPHAGRAETALQLALDPARVRADRIVRGDTRPLAEVLPALRAGGVRAVSPTGVLGDPTGATAVEGRALLADLAAALLADVERWFPGVPA